MFQQTAALFTTNLRNITARPANSLIVVFGIGSVVAILISVFAIAQGFERTLQSTGSEDRALVLRAGSTSEINGSISSQQYGPISNLPYIARSGTTPVAAKETYVTVNLKRRDAQGEGSVPMRGISEQSFLVRPEVAIVAGRNIEFGKYEMIAGVSSANSYQPIELGESIQVRGVQWRVVGLFEAPGSAYQSELWVDERLLAQSRNRGDAFSSMLVKLVSPDSLEEFQSALRSDRRLTAHAIRESDYYASQAEGTAGLIRGVGVLVTFIMAVGAIFAALNTMYSALANRSVEIATLRSLGFHRTPIVGAIVLESALLGLLGALAGSLLIVSTLQGTTLSTAAATSSTFTQIAFTFQVTPSLVAYAVAIAVALGAIGGLLPAIRSASSSITAGLSRR